MGVVMVVGCGLNSLCSVEDFGSLFVVMMIIVLFEC